MKCFAKIIFLMLGLQASAEAMHCPACWEEMWDARQHLRDRHEKEARALKKHACQYCTKETLYGAPRHWIFNSCFRCDQWYPNCFLQKHAGGIFICLTCLYGTKPNHEKKQEVTCSYRSFMQKNNSVGYQMLYRTLWEQPVKPSLEEGGLASGDEDY